MDMNLRWRLRKDVTLTDLKEYVGNHSGLESQAIEIFKGLGTWTEQGNFKTNSGGNWYLDGGKKPFKELVNASAVSSVSNYRLLVLCEAT